MSNDFYDAVDPEILPLIPMFIEHQHMALDELRQALANSDFLTIRTIGHNLKGSGSSYGFEFITDVGRCLEEAGKLCNCSEIAFNIDLLANFLSTLEPPDLSE